MRTPSEAQPWPGSVGHRLLASWGRGTEGTGQGRPRAALPGSPCARRLPLSSVSRAPPNTHGRETGPGMRGSSWHPVKLAARHAARAASQPALPLAAPPAARWPRAPSQPAPRGLSEPGCSRRPRRRAEGRDPRQGDPRQLGLPGGRKGRRWGVHGGRLEGVCGWMVPGQTHASRPQGGPRTPL